MTRWVLHALVVALAFARGAAAEPPPSPAPPPPPEDGFHVEPSLFWKQGEHRVDVGVALRVRMEAWDAVSDHTDWYTALRSRVKLQYGWGERFFVGAELQDLRVHSMDADITGAGKLYRDNSGGNSEAHGTDLRGLWLEARPVAGTFLRVGRQDVKFGSEVTYGEPAWKYLKGSRLGERLVGTVGWTHAERAYDGIAGGAAFAGHNLFGFVAHPTSGVFDIDSAYQDEDDILVGGLGWTVKRDTWLPQTELGAFFLGYRDDRPVNHGGLPEPVEVYTAGLSWLGLYTLGPGTLDTLAWVAGQTGDYNGLRHEAYAGILEIGYQLPEVVTRPWLRIGVNAASGDPDPRDGKHETFFTMLPTKHIYYGFADQTTFQNLVDTFVQLRATPHERLALNFFVHRLTLADRADAKYSGTGYVNRKSFGFPAQASRGYRYIGTELDLVGTLTLHRAVSLEAGYSKIFGGNLLRGDVLFGYVALEVKY